MGTFIDWETGAGAEGVGVVEKLDEKRMMKRKGCF